jgi:protein MpaA
MRILQQTLGYSYQHRPITGYFYLPNTPNSARPPAFNTVFMGAFHGDEGISTDLLTWFHQHLEAHSPAFELPFAIIPTVNPDGLAKASRVNARGVDLNRNFPTQNWQRENEETPYFSGESPASEPETQVIIDFLTRFPPAKIVSLHSPYEVINFDGPARGLAEAMAQHNGYPVVESIGYPTPGSFGTYAGVERHIPTITLELPEGMPPAKVWKDHQAALWTALQYPSPQPQQAPVL